jgi:hypothetical protein
LPDAARHAVLTALLAAGYRGVLTLEVFTETDFIDSLDRLQRDLGVLRPLAAPVSSVHAAADVEALPGTAS